MDLPFSQACENNKGVILDELAPLLGSPQPVLEIGSGTGQHAVHFARALPHLVWQTSDRKENLATLEQRLRLSALPNLPDPLELDIDTYFWQPLKGSVYSANTAHIMAWPTAIKMIQGVARHLPSGAYFCLYGPFNYHGQFTSDSNREFDLWLKRRNPQQGIRDFEEVNAIAEAGEIFLERDISMPANNRLLVWRKP